MKLVKKNSPYIKKDVSVNRMMGDVLIALSPLTIFTSIIHGFSAIYVILLSVSVMILSEYIFMLIMHKKDESKKFSWENVLTSSITGLIYALLLPAGTEPYIVIIGALFAIIVGKLIFGGTGSNIFNPAAVGRIFTGVCFPLADTKYYTNSKFYDLIAGATPVTSIKNNLYNFTDYKLSDLFLGLAPGSLGEVSKLCILIGGVYLVIRKSADYRPMLYGLLSFFLLMLTAGIVMKLKYDDAFDVMHFTMYEFLSGGFMFGVIFMINDPVTSPVTSIGRMFFGILVAVVTAFVRLFGAYSEGFAFGILIGNMLTPVIDYYKWANSKPTKFNVIFTCSFFLLAVAIIAIAL